MLLFTCVRFVADEWRQGDGAATDVRQVLGADVEEVVVRGDGRLEEADDVAAVEQLAEQVVRAAGQVVLEVREHVGRPARHVRLDDRRQWKQTRCNHALITS